MQNGTVHAGVLMSHATALLCSRSPDMLGDRVLRKLISCSECHRIPLTRSVFIFGTIKDTPNIIRTGCKRVNEYLSHLQLYNLGTTAFEIQIAIHLCEGYQYDQEGLFLC